MSTLEEIRIEALALDGVVPDATEMLKISRVLVKLVDEIERIESFLVIKE